MFKNKISLFIIIISCASSYAQLGGQSTYQFLNLVSSPRQAALGGKVLTNRDYDVTQALYNPAAINVDMDNQLSVNFSNYFADISYGTAAYAYTWDRRTQTFHAGVTYVDYGDFDGYDEDGVSTGNFTGKEAALSAGYAFQIGYSDFYCGSNIKLITSTLEQYSSFGIATDLGLMYVNDKIGFQAALVVRNLGMQITTYADQRENIPLDVTIGFSQKLKYIPVRWHLTFENLQQWPIASPNPARASISLEGDQTQEEVGFFTNVIRHTIVAAELFPEKAFNIRLGYNFRRSAELGIEGQRNFSGLSAGFALKMNKFRFSYTHARYTAASNTSFLGVHVDLK